MVIFDTNEKTALQKQKQKIEALPPPIPKHVKHEKMDDNDDERFFDTKEKEDMHPKVFEYLKDLSETPQYFDTQYVPHLDDEGYLKMGNTNIKFGMKTINLIREGEIIDQYSITLEPLNFLFTNTSPMNVIEKTKKT